MVWTKSTYPNKVNCVKFSPDDKYVAYGMSLLEATNLDPVVLNAESGEVFKVLKGHKDGWILDLDFHPNGLWLATASNSGEIIVWDYKSGVIIKRIEGLALPHSLLFTPDGQYLISLENYSVMKKWSTVDWALSKEISVSNDYARQIEISQDGKYIGLRYIDMNDNYDIDFYDAKTFAFAFSISDAHSRTIEDIAFSPDGKYLASAGGKDPTVKIWDVDSKQLVKTYSVDCEDLSVCFSKDNKYIVVGGGCWNKWYTNVWDLANEKVEKTYDGIQSVLTTFSNNNEKILLSHGSYEIMMYDKNWTSVEMPDIKDPNKINSIVPNPANDLMEVVFNSERAGIYQITITDIVGNALLRENKEFIQGKNIFTLKTDILSIGAYILNIYGFNKLYSEKFIIRN